MNRLNLQAVSQQHNALQLHAAHHLLDLVPIQPIGQDLQCPSFCGCPLAACPGGPSCQVALPSVILLLQ